MLRWILLISCVCLVTLEARRLAHENHRHHVSTHAARKNHSPRHVRVNRAEGNEEASDENSEDDEENSLSSESSKEKHKDVCHTEACHQTAQFIRKSMDESVDPCEDFHKYTCGKWAKHYKIPPYMPKWSAWDLLTSTVNNQQRELLSKEVQHDDILPLRLSKKWYQSCVNTDEIERKGVRPLLHVLAQIGGWPMAMEPNEWDEEAYSWQRVDKYYARLTGSPTFVQIDVVPDWFMLMLGYKNFSMILQIDSLQLPFEELKEVGNYKRSNFYKREDYKRLIEETAVALAKERSVDVSRDSIAEDIEELFKFEKNILKIFSLYEYIKEFGSEERNQDKKNDDDNKKSDDESNDDADSNNDSEDSDNDSNNEGKDSDESSDDDESEDKSNSNVGSGSDNEDSDNSVGNDSDDENSANVSDDNSDSADGNNESDDSENFVRKIRRRAKKVAKKHAKKFLRRRILSEYSEEDEDEAEKEAEGEIVTAAIYGNSMKAIFKELNIDPTDMNIQESLYIGHLQKLYSLIQETPKRTVVNYIHWKFISGVVQHTTEELRTLYSNITERSLGRTEQRPRWLWCLDQVGTKEVISYEYVKNYFPSDAKEVASNIIQRIRDVIDNEIDKSPWMSEELKKAAKDKVHSMRAEVGYPSWYDNATDIERYYKGIDINRDYFDNMLNFRKYECRKKFQKMNSTTTLDSWNIISPLTVNAVYIPMVNSLTVTAVDFQRPFFDISQPAAINFGIIGYVIGHEISHGFDPRGRMFDKDGTQQKWPSKDNLNYMKRAECFVRKYSAYTLELKELNTTIRVDGRKTIGDNVADCTGLQAVHESYRIWREEHKDEKDLKLPGLEKFSDDQLFYLASAALWCDVAAPEYMKYLASKDNHSPMSVRILGAVSNTKHFADAFNCPKGSPMNPVEKCSIWK